MYIVRPLAAGGGEFSRRRSDMDNDNETIGGYAVPVDPMDMLQCESCQ